MDIILTGFKIMGYLFVAGIALEIMWAFLAGIIVILGSIFGGRNDR